MNPTPLLTMLNMPQHDENNLPHMEIVKLYADVISKMDSETIDNWSNNVYRVPGTICYTKEEFEALPHVCSPRPVLLHLTKQISGKSG